jgi:hypothetical protein
VTAKSWQKWALACFSTFAPPASRITLLEDSVALLLLQWKSQLEPKRENRPKLLMFASESAQASPGQLLVIATRCPRLPPKPEAEASSIPFAQSFGLRGGEWPGRYLYGLGFGGGRCARVMASRFLTPTVLPLIYTTRWRNPDMRPHRDGPLQPQHPSSRRSISNRSPGPPTNSSSGQAPARIVGIGVLYVSIPPSLSCEIALKCPIPDRTWLDAEKMK